jgi:hypothetical protein
MSGGSLDYVYGRVDDAAGEIRSRATRPEHKAFADHLVKVAKALHDCEWVFSSDYGPGDELESIMQCIKPAAVIEAAIKDAEKARDNLTAAIKAAQTWV